MWLIVGLGNPGKDYEWTRHNLGFLLIDRVARDGGIPVGRRECQALVGRGQIEDCDVKLIKPQTFMNLSGETVACLVRKHQAEDPDQKLIVISDDLALPFGTIRIRSRGSAGGHNGLKSIIESIGTDEFIRLRIGIQPDHPISDAKRFVLSPIPVAQRTDVEKVLERSSEALRTILKHGALSAMSQFN